MSEHIKKEDALDNIESYESTYKFNMSEREAGYNNGLEIAACAINNIPSADVVERSALLEEADRQEKMGFIQTADVLRKVAEK